MSCSLRCRCRTHLEVAMPVLFGVTGLNRSGRGSPGSDVLDGNGQRQTDKQAECSGKADPQRLCLDLRFSNRTVDDDGGELLLLAHLGDARLCHGGLKTLVGGLCRLLV